MPVNNAINANSTSPLPVNQGGTSANSFPTNGVVISNTTTTGALSSLSLTDGQVVIGSSIGPPLAAQLTAGTGITITPGNNSITISASPVQVATNYTNVNTSPYVVTSTDFYLSVDTSTIPITIRLPNSTTSNRLFVVKDRIGNAKNRNITITTVGGSVTIDGNTMYTISTNYEAINILFNVTSYEVY